MTGQQLLNIIAGSATVEGLADKDVADTKYRATALGYLNLIIQDIQTRQESFRWRFLEKTATMPTVASQLDYDLPTDIDTNKLVAVFDRTQDRTYKFIPYEKFVRLYPDPSNDTGDPSIYTFFANVLKLYPVPSSVFTVFLNYIKVMTDAADDSTDLDIPDRYRKVIIDGILTFVYKFDPELGDELKQTQLYELGIKRMIVENNQMIDERAQSQSHRSRSHRHLIHGENSLLFPLADF